MRQLTSAFYKNRPYSDKLVLSSEVLGFTGMCSRITFDLSNQIKEMNKKHHHYELKGKIFNIYLQAYQLFYTLYNK